jgi:hypothetical protein
MDLSAQVHSMMLESYPELAGPPPYDDQTEYLPLPPTTAHRAALAGRCPDAVGFFDLFTAGTTETSIHLCTWRSESPLFMPEFGETQACKG